MWEGMGRISYDRTLRTSKQLAMSTSLKRGEKPRYLTRPLFQKDLSSKFTRAIRPSVYRRLPSGARRASNGNSKMPRGDVCQLTSSSSAEILDDDRDETDESQEHM